MSGYCASALPGLATCYVLHLTSDMMRAYRLGESIPRLRCLFRCHADRVRGAAARVHATAGEGGLCDDGVKPPELHELGKRLLHFLPVRKLRAVGLRVTGEVLELEPS